MCCECGKGIGLAEILSEARDDPVGIAQPGRIVGELTGALATRRKTAFTNGSRAFGSHGDRRAHGRVGGRAEERELIGAEAKGGARREVGRMPDEAVGEPIARSPHAHGAVDELGGEGAITVREVGARRAAAGRARLA